MADRDDDLVKIRDLDMRALARLGADEVVNVLVELAATRMAPSSLSSGLIQGRPAFRPVAPDSAGRQRFDDFGGFLEQIGVEQAQPISVANAYSVSLAARSLPEIAAHPLVVGIDPNIRRK